MEPKKIMQTIRAYGISTYNCYSTFMHQLNVTREKIKKLYPEVEDKDIEINISYEDFDDSIELKFDFPRFETIEEQNKRLANKAKLREIEKEKMINEIKSFFKLHPELKEEILNS